MKIPFLLILVMQLCTSCATLPAENQLLHVRGSDELQKRGAELCGKLIQIRGEFGRSKGGDLDALFCNGEVRLIFKPDYQKDALNKLGKKIRVTGILECPPPGRHHDFYLDSNGVNIAQGFGSYVLYSIRVQKLE